MGGGADSCMGMGVAVRMAGVHGMDQCRVGPLL